MTVQPAKAPASGVASGPLARHLLALLTEGDAHAYELGHRLVAEGRSGSVRRGNLYRVLRRMEADGLVTSHWEFPDSGPARRVYTITEAGLASVSQPRLRWTGSAAS